MSAVDYDARAGQYAATRGLPLDAIDAWREALRPHLAPHAARRVLDVGSGGGHFAVALAEWFGVRVIGVEPAAGMRAVATREPHPRVAYVGGRAERLPLATASCAAAWLSTVIHHVCDLAASARELRRVLAPGAPVLIRSAFPGRHDRIALLQFFPAARRVAERFPSIAQVDGAMRAVGLRLERTEDVPQRSAATMQAFCDGLPALRRADSTLAALSDEEFAAGVGRAERAAAEHPHAPVVDYLTLLVFREGGGG